MNKKCPYCNNETFEKMTKDKTKFGLVKVDFTNGQSLINVNAVIPVDVLICKKCGFISLYYPNLQFLEQ